MTWERGKGEDGEIEEVRKEVDEVTWEVGER